MSLIEERPTTTLRAFLVAAGVTQVAVAAAVGVTAGHLNMVVNGRRRPGARLRSALADVLEVDESTLFTDLD